MAVLKFNVQFIGPFAVATGCARDGIDTTVDVDNLLPASALKGLLKAQLRDVLGASRAQVNGIFHSGDATGWVFRDGQVQARVNLWTRVKVDDEGRADERHLMVGEQAFATRGSFEIVWDGPGSAPQEQVLALRAAARCVTSLGSHRRRGLGWVSIIDGEPWTEQDTEALRQWLDAGGRQ